MYLPLPCRQYSDLAWLRLGEAEGTFLLLPIGLGMGGIPCVAECYYSMALFHGSLRSPLMFGRTRA